VAEPASSSVIPARLTRSKTRPLSICLSSGAGNLLMQLLKDRPATGARIRAHDLALAWFPRRSQRGVRKSRPIFIQRNCIEPKRQRLAPQLECFDSDDVTLCSPAIGQIRGSAESAKAVPSGCRRVSKSSRPILAGHAGRISSRPNHGDRAADHGQPASMPQNHRALECRNKRQVASHRPGSAHELLSLRPRPGS